MSIDKLLFEILNFCVKNKITYEYNTNGDMNSAHYEAKEGNIKFIITIVNVKDKFLYTIIDEGFNNLKKFIEQLSAK